MSLMKNSNHYRGENIETIGLCTILQGFETSIALFLFSTAKSREVSKPRKNRAQACRSNIFLLLRKLSKYF